MPEILSNMAVLVSIIVAVLIFGILAFIASTYKKVTQGRALVRTGFGRTVVEYDKGLFVIPVFHMLEVMDISVKTIEVARMGKDGLICQDNMRADIKVVFFVRVNKNKEDIIEVAQTIGCARASNQEILNSLFDAKFSEALKTVGKRFDFVELYDSRDDFKEEILRTIGKDLNGYILDDCAIDYLEQTPITFLKVDNILDSEGIKKITELTAQQNMQANFIRREEEKTITQQNVEAQEAILELNRQLAEKEARQKREINSIQAREEAATVQVQEEERLKEELKRIETEEGIEVAEQNKERQIVVARKNKERTEAIEIERVEKDRSLEATEREKIVSLAQIEKEKALEEEKRNIQDVIRERIAVERKTAEEEEKINDLRALAEADRHKQVALKKAEEEGESSKIREKMEAEALKIAAEVRAEQVVIDADAQKNAAMKEAEARKIQATAKAEEEATIGLAEAKVIEAKAEAKNLEGTAEASVLEKKAIAEAKAIELKAEALRKQGLAEAEVTREKGQVEATLIEQTELAKAKGIREQLIAEAAGIEQKAEAMKKLNGVGRDHEEFRLRLEKDKEVEIAEITANREIAEAQALILSEAMRNAKIDIVGGEAEFFKNIMHSIGRAKSIDRLVSGSKNLSDVKNALLGDGETHVLERVRDFMQQATISSEDIKNMTLSALLARLYSEANGSDKDYVAQLVDTIRQMGIGGRNAADALA